MKKKKEERKKIDLKFDQEKVTKVVLDLPYIFV